jgi:hypothetical protein
MILGYNSTMSLPPLLFSSGNGDYQLFNPDTNQTIDNSVILDRNIYHISIDEIEKIKNKQLLIKLSNYVEKYLDENREDSYHLTKYTLFQVDDVQCEIYIYVDYHYSPVSSYYYKIVSKNIQYESIDLIEKDLFIYESSSFTDIVSLLEHIKQVELTYKFLDYYLLSPEKMEEAKSQRVFLPIDKDKVCCVCYDPTVEYSKCKHYICLKCRDKCIVQEKITCPVCRSSSLSIYPNTL